LVVGAMIASGFDGFYTKYCNYGKMKMWFFGARNNWNSILTAAAKDDEDGEISKSILQLLDSYLLYNQPITPQEKLKKIIDDYLNNVTDRNWRYYFLYYPKILNYPKILSEFNYFAWIPKNDFEIRILDNDSRSPLLAYHINPYVLVASNILDDEICKTGDCYSQNSDMSGLVLKNRITLYCEKEGWRIALPEGFQLENRIKQNYNIGDELLLKETNDKDRIEIAVDFCKDLIS